MKNFSRAETSFLPILYAEKLSCASTRSICVTTILDRVNIFDWALIFVTAYSKARRERLSPVSKMAPVNEPRVVLAVSKQCYSPIWISAGRSKLLTEPMQRRRITQVVDLTITWLDHSLRFQQMSTRKRET